MHFSKFQGARVLVAMALALTSWVAQAQTTLRVTAIPDESPTELARKAAPLVNQGETVTLVIRQGGMEVRSSGVALSGADLGERVRVRNELKNLSVEQRQVVLMHEYLGMTFAEISATFQRPLGTVLSQMNRAVAHLRRRMVPVTES